MAIRTRNTCLLWALLSVSPLALTFPLTAQAHESSQTVIFSIPAQDLGTALNLWAAQSGQQIFYPSAQIAGRKAPAVSGSLTRDEALKHLIAGSGLVIARQDRGMVSLRIAARTETPVKTSFAAPPSDVDVPIEEVVVVGERAVDQANVARKYQIDEIYDSVNVDEAGQLPDFNIPDAMRRISGVSAIFDEDEGQFSTARGLPLSYNLTTFDDMTVATVGGYGDGSRNVNMQAIPATALSRLEVYKSHMSDQDLGWIGAHFNINSRSAFDAKGRYLVARGKLNSFSDDKTPTDVQIGPGNHKSTQGSQAEFTWSDRFGDNDQFGVMFAGSYYYKSRHQQKTQYNTMYYTGTDSNGDGVGDTPVVAEMRAYAYTNVVERYGGMLKLEWKPSPQTYLSWNSYVYTMFESENRFMHGIRGISLANTTVTSPTTGTFTKGYGEIQAAYFPNDRRQSGTKLYGEHRFANDGELSFDLGISHHLYQDDNFPDISIRTATNLAGTYDTSQDLMTLTPNATSTADWYNAAKYVNVTANDIRSRESQERVVDFKADYDWHTRGYDGWGFKTGLKVTDLYRKRDDGRIRGKRGTSTGISAYDFTYLSNLEIAGREGQPLLMLDYSRWQEVMGKVEDTDSTYAYNLQDDNAYSETISAAYAMTTFTGERFKFAGGLRYEDVDVGGWYYAVEEAGARDNYNRQSIKGGYSALKPSLSLRYGVTDNLRLKLAYSETLGRPSPDQVSISGETVSFNLDDELVSATRGNPDLKPRQSSNYDAALEFYPNGRKNLMMVGVFYKDIKDEIVTRKRVMDIVYDDMLYEDVTVRQPENVESASVLGAEAQIILSDMSFLPAPFDRLNFNANALVTEAEMQYSDTLKLNFLPYQSKFVANVSVSYDWTKALSTRLAYNYLGGYQDGISLNTDETAVDLTKQTRWSNWETIDLKAQYNLNRQLRFEFEIKNLTDANRRKMQGPGFNYVYEENEFGRSVFLGATYRY
ncbi:TonB-dependent receptor [Asticcacaulis sp. SL142]|uniref:TonB-dependent receptor n=1 Tax=Asticcacaulis sp. SL142 TaxID=2995155 RepID=UPI00226CB07F|nr:TonB-dependent receptor [Asticcacaulis sp. SL142]WAC47791.1 TonB-dependent receptor [Asticcacaulis sp. SL142]